MSTTSASTTTASATTFTGVITRICNFKYGFLRSEEHENIFFHFSELSDEAKAFIDTGSTVTFTTAPNGAKLKAVGLQVISSDSVYKNLNGEVTGEMQARGFCFIKSANGETYLFHSENLVNDDASKEAGNTVTEGHMVMFDAEFNHKHSPPKPFAVNVRIVPGQTEKSEESAALELQPWKRSSMGENAALTSPPRKLTRNSSVRDRASALKSNAPARRWSRTTNINGDNKSSGPAGGLDMKATGCKFGTRCTNKSCWFEHPNGRTMDGNVTEGADESSDEESAKVSSMGKASLTLLVKAIVADTGKSSYLSVRNALQSSEYVGRALTREEKHSVGEILEEENSNKSHSPTAKISMRGSLTTTFGPPGAKAWSRGTGRSSFTNSRASFTGGLARKSISLADMCRDPSIHSRLSSANNGVQA